MAGALGGDEPLVSEVSELDAVPDRFNGFIVTDYIERIGPAAKRRWPRPGTKLDR